MINEVRWVGVDTLKPNPKNNNKHTPEQITRLARIIKYQGLRSPIIVSNQSGLITKGHATLAAAIEAGLTKVPVSYQDYEDEAQEFAHLTSDNAIAEWATIDMDAVYEQVAELNIPDVDLLGFEEFNPPGEGEADGASDEAPPLPVEPKSKLGDLWTLGKHRLLCGDSTSIDAVDRLMSGSKADMVFTDPPYGMFLETDYDSMFAADKAHRKTGERFTKVKGDHEDFNPDFINTIFAAFDYCDEIFLWGADYYSDLLPDRKEGSWVVWDKRCTEEMDRVSGNTFELCWSRKKHKRLIARIQWSGHHGMQRDDTKTRVHPTQKPTALAEWFFENWGSGNDAVVDLFGGSGSTLIACEKTKRRCFVMELEPKYVDVMLERWAKHTGKDPVRDDGVKWSEL